MWLCHVMSSLALRPGRAENCDITLAEGRWVKNVTVQLFGTMGHGGEKNVSYESLG